MVSLGKAEYITSSCWAFSFFLSFFARRMIRDWVTGASGVKRWLTRRTCVYFSLSLSDYLGLLSRLQ